jgi:hypothetical protein
VGADRLAPGCTWGAAPVRDRDSQGEEEEMTNTMADIAEYNLVMLRSAVDGWPVGTRGHVVAVFPMNLWVEVADEQGEEFDLVWAAPEELQLVERWRRPERDLISA